jgi:hypothetical protein
MSEEKDRYEIYLKRSEYKALYPLSDDFDSSLRFAISMCNSVNEDVCRFWPEGDHVVEIARALGHIPVHYHYPLKQKLVEVGFGEKALEMKTKQLSYTP